MVGGVEEAARINRNLAQAAQAAGIAMSVGSLRCAIEDPALAATYRVRDVAPDVLLFANLGAVQLNRGYGPRECRAAMEMIEADALTLHLNPLQEALQSGGDTDFAGLTGRIAAVCAALEAPVFVKEVGWGISDAAGPSAHRGGRCGNRRGGRRRHLLERSRATAGGGRDAGEHRGRVHRLGHPDSGVDSVGPAGCAGASAHSQRRHHGPASTWRRRWRWAPT